MSKIANAIIRAVPVSLIRFVSRNQWRVPALRGLLTWGASWVKNQDGVILHGVGQGLRFNAGNSHSGFILGNHETEVQQFLASVLRPGMVYYDAGANVGFFATIAARLVGPSGTVVCFEPLPENVHQIQYNAQLNGFDTVLVRCEALGSSNRTEIFHTSAEPTWGMLATVGKLPEKASGKIEVKVRTLDSLNAEGLPGPDVIKMDIEGAEAEALTGARKALRTHRPLLVIELHRTNAAVTAVLEELDYHATVLGSTMAVSDVEWDANIVAVPRERVELQDAVTKVSERSSVT
jgi:FkbM family methyltransferase